MDFVHSLLSMLVFGVVAIKDKNVASCFYPQPGQETKEILRILPLGVGVICSLLYVVFPTKRRGIGYSINNERWVTDRDLSRTTFRSVPSLVDCV